MIKELYPKVINELDPNNSGYISDYDFDNLQKLKFLYSIGNLPLIDILISLCD